MDVKVAFRRAGRRVRDRSPVPPAVVGSTLLSAPLAYLGLLFFGLSAMCYDPGPSAEADACFTSAMALIVVPLLSTLAVPVVIAVWGVRLRRRGESGNRALLSLLWYVPVLAIVVAGFAGA